MRNILSSIGLAKSAGCVVSGEDTVRNAGRSNKVKLILLAEDAGNSAMKRAKQVEAVSSAPLVVLQCSKTELGAALGLSTASIAAITDTGFAAMLLKKLQSRTDLERPNEAK